MEKTNSEQYVLLLQQCPSIECLDDIQKYDDTLSSDLKDYAYIDLVEELSENYVLDLKSESLFERQNFQEMILHYQYTASYWEELITLLFSELSLESQNKLVHLLQANVLAEPQPAEETEKPKKEDES